METTIEQRIEYLIAHLYTISPNINVEKLSTKDGVKWKQYDQYIDKLLEKDIRSYLGEHLREFYWESSYQYVYIK